ncbi:hypothetical protein CBER1_03782 [Cercospora berteroae]|uniref:Uncharacterized protein n=1 Tax=Cercospora berteroae TaxID=357750 RepID=A0A2S6C818_9PEZI|nr:hypothetical protein CBER1_03782 [Cercospora berteroae]
MAWAASRETTRVEDRAYSMLGIFDVSLPVIYGEGERAFRRLPSQVRENLLASSPDAFKDRTYTKLAAGTGGDDQKQYEILGRTIRFHLPVFDMPKKEDFKAGQIYAAVLNCHFEDDPSHYIVIHLICEVSGDCTRTCVSSCDAYEAASRTASHPITVLRQVKYPYEEAADEAWQSVDGSENLWIRCVNKPTMFPDLLVLHGHGCMVTNPDWPAAPTCSAIIDDETWNNNGGTVRLPYTPPGRFKALSKRPSDTPFYYGGHLSVQISDVTCQAIIVDIKIYPRQTTNGHFVFSEDSQIAIDMSEDTGRRSAARNDYNLLRLKRGKNLLAEVHTNSFLSQRFWYIEFRIVDHRRSRKAVWTYFGD